VIKSYLMAVVCFCVLGVASVTGAEAIGSSAGVEELLPRDFLGQAKALSEEAQGPAAGFSSDKIKVLAFVSGKCFCAPEQIEELARVMKSSKKTEVEFLIVHTDEDMPHADRKKFLKATGLEAPAYAESDYSIADLLKINKTPYVIVADRNSVIRYRGSSVDDSGTKLYLAEAIEDLSKNRAVRTAFGRGLGCALRPQILRATGSQ
jgi:hypothetical protein